MRKIICNSFLSKKLKRKIINKIKFSKKMSNYFFGDIKEYSIEEKKITPLLYLNKKIALIIIGDIDINNIEKVLYNLYFPFDIFCDAKIKFNSNLYVNNYYNSILNNIEKIYEYDIVISLDSSFIEFNIDYGFFESCISILANKNAEFIKLNNDYYDYNLRSWNYPEFISDSTKIELLFDNKYQPLSKFCMFCPKYFEFIKEEKIDSIRYYLLLRNTMILSKNIVSFDLKTSFEYCQYKEIGKVELYSNSKSKLLKQIKNYDTVTFDIFDTLITRKFLKPDDIFYYIDKKIEFDFGKEFIDVRKQAEIVARNKLNKDVNIYEIYNEIANEYEITQNQLNKIMNIEIEMEIDNIIPRTDMIEIYNMLIKQNVNVDLISDMYLPKEIIERILHKCKIDNYRKLLVSCEQNLRKDDKSMWKKYFTDNNEKTIHIGDNYKSDYLYVLQEGKPAIKILSSLELINCEKLLSGYNRDDSLDLGLIFNAGVFNSPFLNNKDIEKNINLFGKYFLAPIFLTFFKWLEKNNNVDELLFISREGYYLQKIYKEICKLYNIKELNNNYFLASRRAVSFPCCTNLDDLYELSKLEYNGLISDFFKKRFSYDIKIASNENCMVSLPKDKQLVQKYLAMHKDKLLTLAKKERNNYLLYIKSNFNFIYKKKCAIIDLGYSGTTQYYLSRLINRKINGYYFAITNNKKPEKLGCEIKGCFNEKNNKVNEENSFYKKSLLLESFLSAPEGQLVNFKKDKACFTDSSFNKEKSKYLDKIYDGVIDGLTELKKRNIDCFSIESMNMFYDFTCNLFKNSKFDLEKVLYIDDDFCTDGKKVRKIL